MNNKKLGTAFEKFIVRELSKTGAWVHFLSPDERGAQPFDIIAVKNGKATAIECKTLAANRNYFPYGRLEDNQIYAFEYWMACGNSTPIIAVEYKDRAYFIPYTLLRDKGRVDLEECKSDTINSLCK